jgi:hypothetical protein
MSDLKITTNDGKFICHVWGTHFHVKTTKFPASTGDRILDDLNRGKYENGIIYAYRNIDGTFETDIDCGMQRFIKTRGPRETGNGLRRLGFSQKQVTKVLDATRKSLVSPVSAC